MNAAAKVINQSNLFNGELTDMHMSNAMYWLTLLLVAVLLSAFAVIYSTNSYRYTLSQVELEEQQAHRLELQWGQLLLEQASLATPARVEDMARSKLHMTLPANNNTFLLHAQ